MIIIPLLTTWVGKITMTMTQATLWGLIGSFIIFILGLFAPIYAHIVVILVAVLLDVMLGIIASLRKGEIFTSRRLKDGLINKTAIYGILLASFLMIEGVVMGMLGYTVFYAVGAISTMILFYELISIIEKLIVIDPRTKVLYRILKFVKKTDKKLDDVIDKKLDEI